MDQYLELVRQAKQGNADAFASLYQEIYEDLYRFAVYILKDPVDAQDAVSETVTDAYASIRRLRKEKAFKGWIFRILSAKCKRKLKEYANRTVELSKEMAEQLAAPWTAEMRSAPASAAGGSRSTRRRASFSTAAAIPCGAAPAIRTAGAWATL